MNVEKKLSDWIYKYDSVKYKFDIISDIEIEKPKTLFKYCSLDEYSIDSLYHLYLFVSHPDQFNDLFDCYYDLIKPTEDYLFQFMDTVQNPEENRKKYKSNSKEFLKSFKLHFRAAIYRFYGLVSMTSNNKDVLMWSLYTNNSGFAIEFDFLEFPFKFHGPFRMNYKSNFDFINLENDLDKILAVHYMSNIKNDVWKFENEWRIIVEAPAKQQFFSPKIDMYKQLGGHNRKCSYPKEAIKSISLANHFFEIEETTQIDNKTLVIQLKEKIKEKTKILDFLSQNKILAKIMLRDTNEENQFELNFRDGFFTKTKTIHYRYNAID